MSVEIHPNRVHRTFEETLALDLAVLRRRNFTVPNDEPFPRIELDRTIQLYANTTNNDTARQLQEAQLELRRRFQSRHWQKQNYIYRSLYVDQLKPWLERYQLGHNLFLLRYERLNADPETVLREILEFLQIPDHDFQAEALAKSYSPNYQFLQVQEKKNKKSNTNAELMPHDLGSNNNSSSNHVLVLRNETRDFLRRLFQPYNDQLAELLEDDVWKTVWNGPSRY